MKFLDMVFDEVRKMELKIPHPAKDGWARFV